MKRRDERKNRVKTITTTLMVVEQQKAGPTTPVAPWKNLLIEDHHNNNKQLLLLLLSITNPPSSFNQQVSARKLAATLWEFQNYLPTTTTSAAAAKMRRHDAANGVRLGRRHHHHVRSNYMPDPDQQPASASSLRRHIAAASLTQHHPTMETTTSHALQPPVSPASSMEMTPYHQDATPSSSISFNLKTSTQLLKVLNRIWTLEEQHASNLAFIKALKTDLHHTQSKVKELARERKSNRQEIDHLMKQVSEDKQVRKKREQDQISAAVKSMKEEVEDETRLRKRSESLHRKLAKELTEAKSSLYNAVKEMEKERKRRDVLEDLCDEFAKGIKEYEQEVHGLRQKCDKNWANRADFDGLILHTSESWLDERMQMKLRESEFGDTEQNSVVDKLSSEIATLFKAKQVTSAKSSVSKDNLLIRRRSMESVPLSAPQDEDEAGSNTNCRVDVPGLKLPAISDEDSACVTTNKPAAGEKVKSHRHPSLQVKFEEEEIETQKPEKNGSNNANSMIDHLSQFMWSGSRNIEEGCYGKSIWRNGAHASPVQEWKSRLISTDLDISAMEESSRTTKLQHHKLERNMSLKAKLLEARSKGHHSRMNK